MSAPGLTVLKPGPLTLIEDLGRTGHFRQGVTVGGPADRLSFLWANRLCGNRANTPALEITVGGLELEAGDYCQVSLAGADGPVTIDGAPVDSWCSHNLNPGDRLAVGTLTGGLRLYLAVRGGFRVPTVFGSAATVVRERLGGLDGRALRTGDFLPVPDCRDEPVFRLPGGKRPAIAGGGPLRVVAGWQYRDLPPALRRDFFSRPFRLSTDGDRMGIRLEGNPLAGHGHVPATMISEGLVAGAVQIPPDGLPIVMMADHQTMGGYPKIGTLVSPDLWRLAQSRPGEAVTFAPVSSLRARHLLRRVMRHFESTSPVPA